eukprot:352648-Chlamydomonas_euryale.AAC.8
MHGGDACFLATCMQAALAHRVAQAYGLQTSTIDNADTGAAPRVIGKRTEHTRLRCMRLTLIDEATARAREQAGAGPRVTATSGPKLLLKVGEYAWAGALARSGADAGAQACAGAPARAGTEAGAHAWAQTQAGTFFLFAELQGCHALHFLLGCCATTVVGTRGFFNPVFPGERDLGTHGSQQAKMRNLQATCNFRNFCSSLPQETA